VIGLSKKNRFFKTWEKPHHWRLQHIPLCFIAVFFFSLLAFKTSQATWQMIVEAPRQNKILYSIPVKKGESFVLSYIHSVSKQPVKGTFSFTAQGKIKPLTTEFDSFGPGLPVVDGSTDYSLEDGIITVYHQEEPRDNIRLWVSPLTKEKITINGKQFDLTSFQQEPLLLNIYLQR